LDFYFSAFSLEIAIWGPKFDIVG